jgi:hypothetical protein
MNFSILPQHLHAFADSANFIIKNRYNLSDGIIEQAILPEIPLQPTLHWKTKTHYIVCEVAERPFPVMIKQQFADLVSTGQPIRIIIAYPKDNGLTLSDYQADIKKSKIFGIGYMGVDDNKNGDIEYQGVSLALHIPLIDLNPFKNSLKPYVAEAYNHYMIKGDPDVGLQKVGQLIESIIYNIAIQAKKKGSFSYAGFNPPAYIPQSTLIDQMITASVLDVPILGRCRDFAKDRNSVSHKPKSRKQAAEIENKLKENFIIGTRILKDFPDKIKAKGYRLKP